MSENWLQAANDIKMAVAVCRGIASLADIVGELGNLDDARATAQLELDDLNKQIAEKEAYFAKMLKEKQAELDAMVAKAGFLILDAKKEAQEITRNATNAAGVMLDNAHKEAKKVKGDFQKEVAKLSLELGDLQVKIDVAKVGLADLERDIADRKREHGSITKMIADLKAKF